MVSGGQRGEEGTWQRRAATPQPAPPAPSYGLGLIGALVYFIQTATSFWDGVWGVIQAIVWPAFLVWGVLDYLHL